MSEMSFVGRKDELAQVRAWLSEGPIVTIVGAAGIGKSRLAAEVAAGWAGEHYSLDLSHERDAEGCVSLVARALGLSPSAGAEDVARALTARRQPLLVFDDADHVLADVASLLGSWRKSAPSMRALTTSRERLRIRSERSLELGPLSLEGGDESEAARLFAQRVSHIRPGASVAPGELSEWCAWLEGIPLAIELAAARAPFFGQPTGQRLDVLGGGFRDGHERHTTLRRAIAWSWAMLEEAEQFCLVEAAAFASAFPIDAAMRVLSTGSNVSGALRSLSDKSFVRVLADGRLELYDAVREFAADQDPKACVSATARLDRFLAGQAQREETGVDPLRHDIRAAAQRVVEERSSLDENQAAWVLVRAGQLLVSEGPAAQLQGMMEEGLRVLQGAHIDLRTRLRIAEASGLRMQGRLDDAEAASTRALTYEAELPNEVRSHLLIEVALARHARRNLDGAEELYRRTLALAPSRRTEGRAHANLGAIAHDRGDLDAAEGAYRDALIALGVTGDQRLLGVVRSNLGLLYQERGDLALAQETLLLAQEDLNSAGEVYIGAIHRGNLGQLFLERNDPAGGLAHQEAALLRLRRIGDARSTAICLARLGAARALTGELASASRDIDEAASWARDLGDPLLGCVVDLHQAFIPLARAEQSPDDRGRHLAECHRRIDAVLKGDVAWRLSDDARAARRILEARLGLIDRDEGEVPEDALVVCIESRFFRVHGGEWQDLRRQTPARRILERLVEHRDGLELADLQAAAWPGEQMRADAAKNRIHVALSRLRKRGLKQWIERSDQGYRLAPGLKVHRLGRIQPQL